MTKTQVNIVAHGLSLNETRICSVAVTTDESSDSIRRGPAAERHRRHNKHGTLRRRTQAHNKSTLLLPLIFLIKWLLSEWLTNPECICTIGSTGVKKSAVTIDFLHDVTASLRLPSQPTSTTAMMTGKCHLIDGMEGEPRPVACFRRPPWNAQQLQHWVWSHWTSVWVWVWVLSSPCH